MLSPLLQSVRTVLEVSSLLSQSWSFTCSPTCCLHQLCDWWCRIWPLGLILLSKGLVLLCVRSLFPVLCTPVSEQLWQLGEKWAQWKQPCCGMGTTWGMWSRSAALGVLAGAGFCWNLLDPGVSVPLKFGGVLAPGSQSHAPCCYKWDLVATEIFQHAWAPHSC